jgi:hypothetical protein
VRGVGGADMDDIDVGTGKYFMVIRAYHGIGSAVFLRRSLGPFQYQVAKSDYFNAFHQGHAGKVFACANKTAANDAYSVLFHVGLLCKNEIWKLVFTELSKSTFWKRYW